MSKVLIYNFSGELDDVSHVFPNDRLARLAGIVREQGHEATVLDRANFGDLLRIGPQYLQTLGGLSFRESRPDYAAGVRQEAAQIAAGGYETVFMNLWHGTGFKFSVDLAAELRRLRPGIRIFGVGQKVDWFREHILRLTGDSFDGLVTGLGYWAVALLAQGREPAQTPNLIWRQDGSIRETAKEVLAVDDFPGPLYGPEVYRQIDEKAPVYSLTLSNQACPNACVFCIRPENYGREVRRRPVARVLAELTELRTTRGATHFRIEDSTPPRGALTELAQALLASPLRGQVRLSAFSRVDQNSAEDFAAMARAGFVSLFFGLESLDDGMLRRLRKGTTYEAIRATLRKAHDAGIFTVGCFIFPSPGETAESMETTLRRLGELKPALDSVLAVPAGIQPFTEWGRHPERYGIRLDPNYIEETMIYPVRYEVPIEHWRPLPFRYPLLGRPAEEVSFADIARLLKGFVERVRDEVGIARVPDYYYLIADLLGREPAATAREIVRCIMQRDYAALRGLFRGAKEAAGSCRA